MPLGVGPIAARPMAGYVPPTGFLYLWGLASDVVRAGSIFAGGLAAIALASGASNTKSPPSGRVGVMGVVAAASHGIGNSLFGLALRSITVGKSFAKSQTVGVAALMGRGMGLAQAFLGNVPVLSLFGSCLTTGTATAAGFTSFFVGVTAAALQAVAALVANFTGSERARILNIQPEQNVLTVTPVGNSFVIPPSPRKVS